MKNSPAGSGVARVVEQGGRASGGKWGQGSPSVGKHLYEAQKVNAILVGNLGTTKGH